MRFLVLAAAFCAFPVHAEIYRWVERETGTVKFSNIPPPWYGDAEKERDAPAVEVIRYRGAAAPAKPAAPPKPAAQERPANDRVDPAADARRRAQDAAAMERERRGPQAPSSEKPQAQ